MTTDTTTYTRVLVGTDGSPTATHAVDAAATMAAALRVPLVLATAWYRDDKDAGPVSVQVSGAGTNPAAQSAAWATDVVTEAAARVRAAGHDDPVTETPVGGPADALVKLADAHEGTLTVVGTVGLNSAAERIMGNVPHSLTHHAPGDLLLVQTDDRRRDGWDRVCLATDGSDTAAIAVQHGLEIAAALGVTPTLLTIARDETTGHGLLGEIREGLDDDLVLDTHVHVATDPSRGLVEVGPDYDLLVIGNKGMSGPSRLLGSVSNRVTHHVPTDILLVNTTR